MSSFARALIGPRPAGMWRSAVRRALLVAALAATSRVALAEQPSELEVLLDEPIVSTASRSSRSSGTAPATSSVITAEDIRRYGFRSLDEAINFASLGMVTVDPLHAVEIGSRGVLVNGDYGNHVLLLLDGHALNEPWNGTAYFERGAGVPLELVDHIEVILGPGSVMYGSEAMLGVINIVTKSAPHYAGLHLIAEAETGLPQTADGRLRTPGSGSYGPELGRGYRLAAGAGKTFRLFGAPAELTLQAEYYYSHWATLRYAPQVYGDDAVTGEPKQYAPGAPTGVWGGEVRHANYTRVPAAYGRFVLGDFELAVRAGMYQRGTPQLDSLVSSTSNFDEPNSFERDTFYNVVAGYDRRLSAQLKVGARAYYDHNLYQWRVRTSAPEDCYEGQLSGCDGKLDGHGRVLGGQLQAQYDWLKTGATLSAFGVEMRSRWASSDYVYGDLESGARTPVPGGNYARHDALIAPFFEQTARPFAALDLSAGVRGDFDSRFGAKASPRLAGAFRPWPDATLKVIYAEAFRSPSAYELLYSDPTDEISAPNLRPESVRSLESSFEQRFGAQRIFFGVFRSWWMDMVRLVELSDDELAAAQASGALDADAPSGWQYRNTAHIDNFGFNAGVEGRLVERSLHYALNVTSAYTRIDQGDGNAKLPPTVGPQLFGNARLSYELASPLPTLALALFAMQSRPADRAYDGGFTKTPYAPAHVELRPTASGAVPGIAGLTYRISASWISARRGAYVVGPFTYAADAGTRPELNPVRRVTGYAGLQYDF